ncbi:MAG: hypothetical protein ACRDAM_15335 [Casimicrobium sp.]
MPQKNALKFVFATLQVRNRRLRAAWSKFTSVDWQSRCISVFAAILALSAWFFLCVDVEKYFFLTGWVDYLCTGLVNTPTIDGTKLRDAFLVQGSHWFLMTLAMSLPIVCISPFFKKEPQQIVAMARLYQLPVNYQTSESLESTQIAKLWVIYRSIAYLFGFVLCAMVLAVVFVSGDLLIKYCLAAFGLPISSNRAVYATLALLALVIAGSKLRCSRQTDHPEANLPVSYESEISRFGSNTQNAWRVYIAGFQTALHCSATCSFLMFTLIAFGKMELVPMIIAMVVEISVFIILSRNRSTLHARHPPYDSISARGKLTGQSYQA